MKTAHSNYIAIASCLILCSASLASAAESSLNALDQKSPIGLISELYKNDERAQQIILAQFNQWDQASHAQLLELRNQAIKDLPALQEEARLCQQELKQAREPMQIRKATLRAKHAMDKLTSASNWIEHASKLDELDKNADLASLLDQIIKNPQWRDMILQTGDAIPVSRVVSIIHDIAKQHPEIRKQPGMARRIATATAIEYARNNWSSHRAVSRANFFIESWAEGKLNSSFDQLPFYLLRVTCGIQGNHEAGSLESLQWAQDNMKMPAEHYSGFKGQISICWRPGYRPFSAYGESVHGEFYYGPFNDNYGDNYLQKVLEQGGICGSLSYFGAFCAAANGIPAFTMSEPGHCAHAVYVHGEWEAAYSLSWIRSPHWIAWQGLNLYSALNLAEEYYSPQNASARILSQQAQAIAEISQAQGNLLIAENCYKLATQASPLNYGAWRDWASCLVTLNDQQLWRNYLSSLCQQIKSLGPDIGARLNQHAMSQINDISSEEKLEICQQFWSSCKELGNTQWDVAGELQKQLEWLQQGNSASKGELLCQLFDSIFDVAKGPYPSIIMPWAILQSNEMRDPKIFEYISSIAAESIKGGSLEGNTSQQLIIECIRAAEQLGDIATFRAMSSLADESERYSNSNPQFEPFVGSLISEQGMISCSSIHDSDRPLQHAGLLDPKGGFFHTKEEEDAWVTLQLPRTGELSGIVLITCKDYSQRHKNMQLQISQTGNAGSWETIHLLGEKVERVMRIELGDKKPKARFIRILRKGKGCFHLNGIYIYGKNAA